jgi:hypothetical protein
VTWHPVAGNNLSTVEKTCRKQAITLKTPAHGFNECVPVEISISGSGEAQGRVGSGAQSELSSQSIEGDHVYGVLSADLHEPGAPPPPYDVEFDLFFRGTKLAGAVTIRPGKSSTTQLPPWSELQKIGP